MNKSRTDKPWLPYLAIDYLGSILKPAMTVFEYGSGGSTLFFAGRVNRVISVEHDPEWYGKINALSNVDKFLVGYTDDLIGNDKSKPGHYTSGPYLKNFRNYVSFIDRFENLDLIFIDGRSRAACLKHARQKIKPGGWIVLDNSERDYYLKNTLHLFDGWETVEFFGYGPQIEWPWKTLFLRRPDE